MHTPSALADFIAQRYWPVIKVKLCSKWQVNTEKFLAVITDTCRLDDLNDLTEERAEQWWALVQSKQKAVTANKILLRFKHIFKTAKRWKAIREDHAAVLEKVQTDVREYAALPDEKLPLLQSSVGARLLKRVKPRIALYILLAYYTGARRGSLHRLERADVDLRLSEFHFRKTKARRAYSVPIHPDLYEALGGLLSLHWPCREHEVKAWNDSPYLLYHYEDIDSITRMFTRARNKVGLKGFRYHDFRHNMGGRLGDAGASTAVIMDMLGHSTVTMSVKYTRVKKDTVRTALESAL